MTAHNRRQFLTTATAGIVLPVIAPASARAAHTSKSGPPSLIARRVLFGDPDKGWARISPDGKRIAFLAPFNGVLNLWVAPLADVTKAQPFTRVSDRSLGSWLVWLHDNRHIVFFREQGGDENWQAHRVDLTTGDIKPLTTGPGVKSYVQENSRHFPTELLLAHNERDKRFHDLYRVNVVTGASERIEINDGGFVGYYTDARFRVRFATRYTDDASLEYLERGADGSWTLFTRLAAPAGGDIAGIEKSLDQKHWVLYYERDQGPGRIVHYDRVAKRSRVLFTTKKVLERAPLVAMEPVTLRARDGLQLVCYLSRPLGAVRGMPGPMVLVVHGGPWGRDNWGLSATHQWLANRGYAVLSVNFRGSTGLGKAFVNAANLEWAGKMHDDLVDGIDWAIAEKVADPKRVAILGWSYGGYSALVGLTFTPEKFACAVDVVGISNLLTLLETIPPYWKPWQTIWKIRTGDYTTEAGRRFLAERSPLTHVGRIVRPLLIAHGANDPRVKVAESEQIVAAMRERGIPVTYLYYPDEGHGFRRQENRHSFNAVAEAFLARHLGGRYQPIGDDFKGSTIEFKAGRDLIPGLPE